MKQQQWRTLNGRRILTTIQEEVENVIQKEIAQGHQLQICIGTDSQVKSKSTDFATVIVFLRKGQGGFMYIQSDATTVNLSIKQRMLEEVHRSITIAYELSDLLTKYNIPLEIHIDINTMAHFKSNTALADALGYIKGMGFNYQAKPNAFASSSCANIIVQ